MRVAVEFSAVSDVEKFSSIVQAVPEDVRLTGKDENGNYWDMSAKSLFCSLVISTKMQRERKHNAHNVDWNTIWCECETDIYDLISDYVRVSPR